MGGFGSVSHAKKHSVTNTNDHEFPDTPAGEFLKDDGTWAAAGANDVLNELIAKNAADIVANFLVRNLFYVEGTDTSNHNAALADVSGLTKTFTPEENAKVLVLYSVAGTAGAGAADGEVEARPVFGATNGRTNKSQYNGNSKVDNICGFEVFTGDGSSKTVKVQVGSDQGFTMSASLPQFMWIVEFVPSIGG